MILGRANNIAGSANGVIVNGNQNEVKTNVEYGMVIGQQNILNGPDQTVIGRCNVNDTNNKYGFIVGCGEPPIFIGDEPTRKNGLAIGWDGNAHIKGDIYANCNNDSTGGSKVLTASNVTFEIDTDGHLYMEVI